MQAIKEIQNMRTELKKYGDEEDYKPISMHLKDIGLRGYSNLIYYLAVENTYDSNLISDIKDVSYIENSNGLMCLTPLEGVPYIFDDTYIFAYVFRSDIVRKEGGGIRLKGDSFNGNKATGPAKIYLDIAKDEAKHAFKGYECSHSRIFATAEYRAKSKSDLIHVMSQIDEDGEILKNAKEFKKTSAPPVGVVGIKLDTSNIPFDIVNDNYERLNEELKRKGFVIGKCDVTYDQAGTLDALRIYTLFLNSGEFREQKEKAPEFNYNETEDYDDFKFDYDQKMLDWKSKGVLLNLKDVQRTSGKNIVKYRTFYKQQNINCKLYNKPVSNFEAGNTQKKLGTHLAEYAYNYSSQYLKYVFNHPQVKECGLTRFEASFCPSLKLKIDAKELLQRELKRVEDCESFHIQPIAKQYEKLRDAITKSCLICNRTSKEIYMFWYGSSLTHRVAAVNYSLKKRQNETEEQLLKHYNSAKKRSYVGFWF